jgi:hypothetical protein
MLRVVGDERGDIAELVSGRKGRQSDLFDAMDHVCMHIVFVVNCAVDRDVYISRFVPGPVLRGATTLDPGKEKGAQMYVI